MLSNALNREQVWLREQALEKEKQRTEELRRQIQEERERMELQKAQNGGTDEDFAVLGFLILFLLVEATQNRMVVRSSRYGQEAVGRLFNGKESD